ncbi:MAG: hypothetical protein ABFE02_13705 [Sulfuricella sp.]
MNKPPIFIHSLFRAGSTYLFNVFRRSEEGYWCYQEPLHEMAVLARSEPAQLLRGFGEKEMRLNRHPQMDTPYFQELHATWPAWKDVLNESSVYDGYFAPSNADIGIPYWRALVDAAKGRPVFQECRTASRIAAIREQFGGYHISLWRNPWDQWWSYKVTEYFDVANQLIINAPNSPAAVQALRSDLGIEDCSHAGIAEAFAHFSEKPLSSEESYLVFYMLWCLGLQQGWKHAHLMLNIDGLSDSSSYRDVTKKQLADAGISGIDFSDCHVPQGFYIDQDSGFFAALEERVHDWLRAGGWTEDDLNKVQGLRQQYQPASWREPIETLNPHDLAEQATRARSLARRYETKVAKTSQEGATKVAQAEARATEAETRANQLKIDLDAVHASNHHHWQLAEASAQQIEAILHSYSWRVTAPLRASLNLLHKLAPSNYKAHIKLLFQHATRYVLIRPKLRNAALAVLNRFPRLKNRVARIVIGAAPQPVTMKDVPADLAQLTPRARQTYSNLKAAIECRQKENG